MTVRVQCPNPDCGASLAAATSDIGRRARCTRCETRFIITPTAEQVGLPTPTGVADSALSGDRPAPERMGRYEIRRKLGSGAFGTVYLAHDPVMDRSIALKVPHDGLIETPTAVERFLREARAAARLRHPNIVPAFDAGNEGGRYYLASAFVEGRTLAQVVGERGVEPRRAARIVRDLAEALHHAHELGIVHRDVKPSNVILDPDGHAHLMDFGLARFYGTESARLTQVGSILGTPAYLAPEQATGRGGEADAASDQYSLGVTLFELLTGQTPFVGPLEVVIFATIHQPTPALRAINPDVPPELESICLKALAKTRGGRFATCRELADELGRWLDGRPSPASQGGAEASPVKAGPSDLPIALRSLALGDGGSLLAGDVPLGPAKPARLAGVRPRWAWLARASPPILALAAIAAILSGSPGTPNAPGPRPGHSSQPARKPPLDPRPKMVRSEGASGAEAEGQIVAPRPAPDAHLEIEAAETEAASAASKTPAPTTDAATLAPPTQAAPAKGADGKAAARAQQKATRRPGLSATDASRTMQPRPLSAATNSIGMKFVLIPSGEFQMGSDRSRLMFESEGPRHLVKITKPFYIGAYEVTTAEYELVMNERDIPDPQVGRMAAGRVSWNDADTFCRRLSIRDGRSYRLPTEAEWEYACRADSDAAWSWGDSASKAERCGWFKDNSRGSAQPVGLKLPNAWGLYDMHGNVWEHCVDSGDTAPSYRFSEDVRVDPVVIGPGNVHMQRGGSFHHDPAKARAANRGCCYPATFAFDDFGLRVVCDGW